MDLIVRTPKQMKWRLEEGELFLTEIVSRETVLYEKNDEGVGQEGRSKRQAVAALRWAVRVRTAARALLGIRERPRTQ
jgi:hypothetical protein